MLAMKGLPLKGKLLKTFVVLNYFNNFCLICS